MTSRLLMCTLASLLPSACATTGTPPRLMTAAEYAEHDNADYDATKVAAVQQWAHVHGATVLWVNYPRKKPDGS